MKTNVAVFFGGESVEHEVSIISAVQAMHAMDREKYEVIPVYISKQGMFFYHADMTEIEPFRDLDHLIRNSRKVLFVRTDNGVEMVDAVGGFSKRKALFRIDFAFPVVHGTNCEDGTLQGYFELLGLPYAGCDVLSSALGMDKVYFKNVLEANGLPVLPCVSFSGREWAANREQIAQRIEKELGYPVVVKPANLGSSVGIKKASDRSTLLEAISLAASFSGKILAEKAVEQLREINCAVLGDRDGAQASACEEPLMSDEILSYQDKYISGTKSSGAKGMSSLKRRLPAEISPEKKEEIQNLALRTFEVCGFAGVTRIDFLMDTANGDQVYINEANTIPGSLAFYLWEADGMKYTQLLDRIIALGFVRQRRKQNLMFTVDTNILSTTSFGTKGAKG